MKFVNGRSIAGRTAFFVLTYAWPQPPESPENQVKELISEEYDDYEDMFSHGLTSASAV